LLTLSCRPGPFFQIKRAAISTSPAGCVYDVFEVLPKPGCTVTDLDLQCRLHTVLYAHRLQQQQLQRQQQESLELRNEGEVNHDAVGHKRLRSEASPVVAAAAGGGDVGGIAAVALGAPEVAPVAPIRGTAYTTDGGHFDDIYGDDYDLSDE
jgi:hypothetical protein